MKQKIQDSQTIIQNFCNQFDIIIPDVPTFQHGDCALVNPDIKNMATMVSKYWRKLAEAKLEPEYLEKNPEKTFDLVSDYVRCSVLIPSFVSGQPVIEAVAQAMGGKLSIHNRPGYKAVHLHTQIYPDASQDPAAARHAVNAEVQFHTPATNALKEATHAHYEKFRDRIAKDPNTKNDPEYIKEDSQLVPLCNVVYQRSGFDEALPDLQVLMAKYQATLPPMQFTNFTALVRTAWQCQDTFTHKIEQILTKYMVDQASQHPEMPR